VVVLVAVCARALAVPGENNCYRIWSNAARHWWAGADLYSPDRPGEYGLGSYRYSPLVAILLTPFGLLPDALGGVAWRLANAGLLAWALAWWCRAVLPRALTAPQKAVLFLLVLPLAVGNFNNGQANALVLSALLAATAAAAEDRWNLTAILLALAALVKIYPLALGLLLVAVYARPLAGRLTAALAVGLLLPFALQRPEYVTGQYTRWLEVVGHDDRSTFALDVSYRDFALLCRVWLVPLSNTAYRALEALTGAALAGLCVAAKRAGWPRRRLLTLLFCVGTCWMTLFGPATESCTYILVAPALGWALLDGWLTPRPAWLRRTLLLSCALLAAALVACWFPFGRSIQALGPHPLAVLLLLSCQLSVVSCQSDKALLAPCLSDN
jgi:hypothetical protein